jgi:1-deoxyxylulose-5-phosphate synthase
VDDRRGPGPHELHHWDRFITNQPRYSLLYRQIEADVLPVCERQGLGILPWSPLAAGMLSGKYHKGEAPTTGRWSVYPYNEQFAKISDWEWATVELVRSLATEHGCEPAQVACAWLLSRKAVPSVLGGANSLDQMKTYIGAADVKLTAEQVAQLDEVSAPAMMPAGVNPPWKAQLAV